MFVSLCITHMLHTDIAIYMFYRVLVQYKNKFASVKKYLTWHIPSKYTKEMGSKSTIVSGYKYNILLTIATC